MIKKMADRMLDGCILACMMSQAVSVLYDNTWSDAYSPRY